MNQGISSFLVGFLIAAVLFGLWSYFQTSSGTGGFTDAQKQEIERISGEYFVSHPEILSKAYEKLVQQKQKQEAESTLKAISDNVAELTESKNFELGNPQGDIVLVEFLDYQCPHCKKMDPVIEGLIKANPSLRVVIKELPIFGDNSKYAAKAAMAAEKQGKFSELHSALLNEKEPLKEEKVHDLAKDQGLDLDKLKEDIQQAEFDQHLTDAYKLATQLSIRGTPYFILIKNPGQKVDMSNVKVIPGEISQNQVQQYIDTFKK